MNLVHRIFIQFLKKYSLENLTERNNKKISLIKPVNETFRTEKIQLELFKDHRKTDYLFYMLIIEASKLKLLQ
jgi:hypothetical protein